jgi:isopentenyl-diphosphate delta-isomerase
MSDVILVNEQDQPIGRMSKLEAHQKGELHRAFSVFIFNDNDEMLLQRRAADKYHSGGLWTNTCCSHPFVDEATEAACGRRLQEEMGFRTELEYVTSFIYKAELDRGLYEHEFDHVYIGRYNEAPQPDPQEVAEWKYMDLATLESDMALHPEQYTVWFRIIFSAVKNRITAEQYG